MCQPATPREHARPPAAASHLVPGHSDAADLPDAVDDDGGDPVRLQDQEGADARRGTPPGGRQAAGGGRAAFPDGTPGRDGERGEQRAPAGDHRVLERVRVGVQVLRDPGAERGRGAVQAEPRAGAGDGARGGSAVPGAAAAGGRGAVGRAGGLAVRGDPGGEAHGGRGVAAGRPLPGHRVDRRAVGGAVPAAARGGRRPLPAAHRDQQRRAVPPHPHAAQRLLQPPALPARPPPARLPRRHRRAHRPPRADRLRPRPRRLLLPQDRGRHDRHGPVHPRPQHPHGRLPRPRRRPPRAPLREPLRRRQAHDRRHPPYQPPRQHLRHDGHGGHRPRERPRRGHLLRRQRRDARAYAARPEAPVLPVRGEERRQEHLGHARAANSPRRQGNGPYGRRRPENVGGQTDAPPRMTTPRNEPGYREDSG